MFLCRMIKGKKAAAGGKPKSSGAGQSNPSKEELRKTICEILKKVDFNTVSSTTLTLASYKVYIARTSVNC